MNMKICNFFNIAFMGVLILVVDLKTLNCFPVYSIFVERHEFF